MRCSGAGLLASLPSALMSRQRSSPSVRRGWHQDECAALLRGLDARRLHVDSAGYAWPLCAEPKPGQGRYALCCRSGRGVTVNQEYLIQLGAVAELSQLHGWPSERLRVELGEFDAAALDDSGTSVLLMEAKCRAAGPSSSADTLEKLLRSWLRYARDGAPVRGTNAANKYLYLRDRVTDGPVTVVLVAAGAWWWLRANTVGRRRRLRRGEPAGLLIPKGADKRLRRAPDVRGWGWSTNGSVDPRSGAGCPRHP